ncbi:MAG: protein kinase [Planctomycetes bacterium]|nr:protein kinase [Planctomycetota bacterium]MCB9934957.1 protein kinase [Planctomycetota bacterium]
MPNTQTEIDQAFLNFVLERGHITALEAETLRSELRRKQATQKNFTMQALLIHKGHLTQDHADNLFNQMMEVLSQPTLLPDEDETGRAPQSQQPERHTSRRPTNPVDASARPTSRRPTDSVDKSAAPTDKRPTSGIDQSAKPTDRNTRPVEDSRTTTGDKRTTARGSNGAASGWNLHKDTDALSATDKAVPAGTIIAASEMTIAQVRQKIGIDDGVKLLSDKMQSSLAQYQPDATADKKRYVVIREIARGGMGKVLEVEDTELRRSVALKVLRKELLGRRDVVERFLEEAQITGQLEHPNIVPVHEMGVDGAGNLYFTMKFVEGLSLAEVLLKLREGNRDALREYDLMKLLDVFIKICEGMSFAHNRGVIHRDLKPANIMVGRFGEVQVMDWGVAKVVGRQFRSESDSGIVLTDRLDQGSAHTMMGAIIGTPSFMSPEQAKGDIDAINHHSDIFSLGVILYEMLCLRSPWTGKSSDEVLEQVREMTPLKPRERNPEIEVPAELERLALKCLEKEPERRVDTVAELAENIRNFIEGRAMGSVEYSPMRLAIKWVGRYKKEVGGLLLMLLLVAGAIFGTLWYIRKLDQDKVLTLNDDAKERLAEWTSQADEGNFDEAEAKIEEARNLFQKVLAVDEEDEIANAGLNDVADAAGKLREMRATAAQELALREQRDKLISEAEKAIRAGLADQIWGFRQMEVAYDKASAAMALDPKSKQANVMKAQAANELAKWARNERRWEIMKLWIDRLEVTGQLPEEFKARRQEWRQH